MEITGSNSLHTLVAPQALLFVSSIDGGNMTAVQDIPACAIALCRDGSWTQRSHSHKADVDDHVSTRAVH